MTWSVFYVHKIFYLVDIITFWVLVRYVLFWLHSNNLKQWARDGYFDRYISAHTHSGENIQHKDFFEVNIGSLVDAPIEYMTLVGNNSDNNNHVEIHHNFLTQPETKQMKKRLSKLIDYSWSDKSNLCSDKEMSKMKIFQNRSFREFTKILHKNSRKGQKYSLLQEIEIYL